ncbi:MAG: dTDP-4-dehydrorhamnose reductase [Thermodesulfovibrionales bacterium]
MKILITGAKGMLAHDLIPVLEERHVAIARPREELDITARDRVYRSVQELSPDIVINCAAYTQVDKAEGEREKAFLVNGIGVQNLALACSVSDIPLCHISTDYVFDGEKGSPYSPFDNTRPVNVYGESKLAGEKYIQWLMNKFYIVRTSWLYGKGGNNFISTILNLSKDRPEIKVVQDQKGSPTSTVSLSHAVGTLIETGAYGIYHFTDETGSGISWYDFAREIVKLSGRDTEIIPIRTDEFPRPAKRPRDSFLDTTFFSLVTGHKPEDWKKALKNYLDS